MTTATESQFSYIEFKDGPDGRLAEEFHNDIDARLRCLLLMLAEFSYTQFGKKLTITCLVRTVEENAEVNGQTMSAHLRRDAGDCRSKHYTDMEIAMMERFVRFTWGQLVLFKYHKGGTGPHIHLNVNWGWSLRNTDGLVKALKG